MKKTLQFLFLTALISMLELCTQCHRSGGETDAAEGDPVVTPVTVIHPSIGSIESTVEVNAVSDFLVKSSVRSTINGYLLSVKVRPGDVVRKGQVMFRLETREAHNLGNTLADIDSTLNFKGTVSIRAPYNGYVKSVNYQAGEYAQEGDPLASVADSKSLVFLLDIPFELTPIISQHQQVSLRLPDGRSIQGHLENSMPSVDSASQTQRIIIRIPAAPPLPANLIGTIELPKAFHADAVLLPREAVLSNEVQNKFWIMKSIDSSIAVKINVRKGLETLDKVEIDSPRLFTSDLILETGNYGLPDSARITIR